jgi:hypothetical protein
LGGKPWIKSQRCRIVTASFLRYDEPSPSRLSDLPHEVPDDLGRYSKLPSRWFNPTDKLINVF